MTVNVDDAFIRRAVELADLNAVRVALYQQTHDPQIYELPMAAQLDDAQRELLISKTVDWLKDHASSEMPAEPDEAELRTLMNLATKEEMPDLEFNARRDLASFKDYPWTASWTNGKPALPENFRVAIVGSGFSGLAAAVQMELLGIPYVVLERRPEPGGTWTINRYPDVRVDTISITYEFSFEKRYPWTEYFGRGHEVREYLQYISKKYGVLANTLFDRDLQKATFNPDSDTWTLQIGTPDGTETMEVNAVINAMGTFANPNFPSFEGMDSFEGQIIHPARWPEDWDATGKRVAVIGNGSTGVQIVRPVSQVAEHVDVYQRTPQWISPRALYGDPVEPEIRWLQDNFPGYWNWWRYMAIAGLFQTHGFILPDEEWQAKGGTWNAMSDGLRDTLIAYIKDQVKGDQELIDKLIPDYAPFSRRPVVDNGWYESLTRDNVELVTSPIVRITPTGIETEDGKIHPVDTIITATGFEVAKYVWPADYLGKDGQSIHDFWSKDGPRAYISMMVPNYPNMWMLYGPNSQPLSGGTGLPIWYVIWAAYAAQCMVKMIEQGKRRVEVKQDAYERYNEALDAEASKTILMQKIGGIDHNYYINHEHNRMQVNAPWYGPEYHRMCTEVEWDDLEIS